MKKILFMLVSFCCLFMIRADSVFASEEKNYELINGYKQLANIFTESELNELGLTYDVFEKEYHYINSNNDISINEYLDSYEKLKDELNFGLSGNERIDLKSPYWRDIGKTLSDITITEKPKYDKYSLLESGIRPGDIVFEKNGGFGVTHHIAIVDDIITETHLIDEKMERITYIRLIEAIIPKVTYSLLDDNRVDAQDVTILRVKNADAQKSQEVLNFVAKQIDTKYSLENFTDKDIGNPEKADNSRNKWYCSLLIWAGFMRQGIDLDEYSGINLGVMPNDILNSSEVEQIYFKNNNKIDYLAGLTISDTGSQKKNEDVIYNIKEPRYYYFKNNYYVVEQDENGKYRYDDKLYFGGGSGHGMNYNLLGGTDKKIAMKPEFHEYYRKFNQHIMKEKDVNYYFQWLNHWKKGGNLQVIKSQDTDIEIEILALNNGKASIDEKKKQIIIEDGIDDKINYLAGLTISDTGSQKKNEDVVYNIKEPRYYYFKNNYYVVEQDENGKYRYDDKLYFGGGSGHGMNYNLLGGTDKKIEMKPEFHKYYENFNQHIMKGKDVNYYFQWLNHWKKGGNLQVIKSQDTDIEIEILALNNGKASIDEKKKQIIIEDGIDDKINYLAGLTISDTGSQKKNEDVIYNIKEPRYYYFKNNYYVVEQDENGKYRYDDKLYFGGGSGHGMNYNLLGGTDKKIEMKPEFHKYYENFNQHIMKGKDVNYYFQWLNHWKKGGSLQIIKSKDIKKYVADLNNE